MPAHPGSMGREISYRLAGADDFAGISNVFAEAFNDLLGKYGQLERPVNPVPPNPIFAFLIRKTPEAFWVAEEGGRIVGFSDSFVRGSFWYFSWLFISPAHQGRDIGRTLLERTLGSWKGVDITNRATITFAFNPASQALYMRYGMFAREPVYFVHGPSASFREGGPAAGALDLEEVTSRDGSAALRRIDADVLGFSLDWSHEYFFEVKSRCYIFRDQGEPVGYAYVRSSGSVGPLAVSSSRFTGPALGTALRLAAKQSAEIVSYWTPGSNTSAVNLGLEHGMRLDPYVFMSTRPFAKWENYLFNSAAMM